MAFTQNSRIWWDTSKPGSGTSQLQDSTPSPATPASPDEDTGIVGVTKGPLARCERSQFVVPVSELVTDPITGRRVWFRFVDRLPEQSESDPSAPVPANSAIPDRPEDA